MVFAARADVNLKHIKLSLFVLLEPGRASAGETPSDREQRKVVVLFCPLNCPAGFRQCITSGPSSVDSFGGGIEKMELAGLKSSLE
jgi:hypothetical protein